MFSYCLGLFSCRKDNPQLLDLAKKFPVINGKSIVAPYLKKNLDDDDLKMLSDRLRDEADLRDELGPATYESLLQRVNRATLTEFALKDLSQERLPIKQRVWAFHRRENQSSFWDQVPRVMPQHRLKDVQRVVKRCFPRFGEGHMPVGPLDWDDISTVINDRKQATDQIAFTGYAQKWKTIDFLERERRFAINTASPGAVWELTGEIETVRQALKEGPLCSKKSASCRQLDWNDFLKICKRTDGRIISLEKLIKGRILPDFLEARFQNREEGEERRKYNLPVGVKQVAEISRLFRDWVRSIQTVLSELPSSPKLRADFQWFEEELERISPSFQAFILTFPAELVEIDRMTPAQIRERFTMEQLENLISLTLDCLNSPFYKIFPTLIYRLQIAQEGETFIAAKAKILERHSSRNSFYAAAQLALPNAFQVPNRVENCVVGLAKALSRPSHLQPKIFRTFTTVKETAFNAEKLRVTQARAVASRELFYPSFLSLPKSQ
jgi:hypothetical protein